MKLKAKTIVVLIILLFLSGPLYVLFSGELVLNQHWRTADRYSAKIAPNPDPKVAVVSVYAARAYGFRGMFAVHTWIATKPIGSDKYTVYQCLGWNLFRNKPIVVIKNDIPDRLWYGNKPWILLTIKGKRAETAIAEIRAAVAKYPYKQKYLMWPGPNSNSFIAYVLRESPAVSMALPTIAIGKDYFPGLCAKTPSRTGFQCSLKGLVGFVVAKKEGVEISILGLGIAINTKFPYIHLPGIG